MAKQQETAILAGGCLWGTQDLIRNQSGVTSTRVGYTGGDAPNATYLSRGNHAEEGVSPEPLPWRVDVCSPGCWVHP